MAQTPVIKNSVYSRAQLEGLVEQILIEAKHNGASSAEAAVSIESGLSVNARMGEVETVEHNHDKGLGVTVFFGQRKGSASTSDFGDEAIRDTVAAACRIARYTAEDQYAGLADAELMAQDVIDLDLVHPWDITPERAIELALESENVARDFDVRIINSEGASVSTHQAYRVYGNSHGLLVPMAARVTASVVVWWARMAKTCSVITGTPHHAMPGDWRRLRLSDAKRLNEP